MLSKQTKKARKKQAEQLAQIVCDDGKELLDELEAMAGMFRMFTESFREENNPRMAVMGDLGATLCDILICQCVMRNQVKELPCPN